MKTLDELTVQIQALQSMRIATLRACLRLESQPKALTRSMLGWRKDLPEKERNAINREAARIVKEVKQNGAAIDAEAKDGQPSRDVSSYAADVHPKAKDVTRFINSCRLAQAPLVDDRKEYEKEMVAVAGELPVAGWVKGVPGMGFLGLAIIVGEAGNLSRFGNPAKLWKWFGMGVMEDGTAQGRMPKGCTAAEWDKRGYNKRRRSALYTIGDSLIKYSKPDAIYRPIYLAEKARQKALHPEVVDKNFTDMHLHRRAQRYMEKRLLSLLWEQWKAEEGGQDSLPTFVRERRRPAV